MATEIVLLSERPADRAVLTRVAEREVPLGALLTYREDSIMQFVEHDGTCLLTVFRTKPIEDAREAAMILVDPPEVFDLWTEITIPFGDAERGKALAASIARELHGTLKERI